MHNYKRYSFMVAVSCAIMLIPALLFPSWYTFLVFAGTLCLAALPVLCSLFVIGWVLTRFTMKGKN